MATRCLIGYQDGNVIRSAYCHWDGYPENVGKLLINHWNTLDNVKQLLSGGDMSSLSKDYTTVDFYTKRGEERKPNIESADLNKYLEYARGYGCNFAYLFDEGEWKFFEVCFSEDEAFELKLVKDVLG